MKDLLILGAGTGGSLMANKLARTLSEDWHITIVDRDDAHVYQPGLLFLPFGDTEARDLVRPRRRLLDRRVRYVNGEIHAVTPERQEVAIGGLEAPLRYDLLIIATGTALYPEDTPGLTGPGWRERVHEFYTLEGSKALAARLERFEGGRLVVGPIEMPIKCPVAPLEFAFLADAWCTKKGIRDKTEIVYVTPLDGAFTKPVASRELSSMMARRNIRVVANFATSEVDGNAGVVKAFSGQEEPFDLLVSVPLHGGTPAMRTSGLGDDQGFVRTDKHTLQSKSFENIFVIGDATDLPTSKAGAVAHFQGDVLINNVLRFVDGQPPLPAFDGHANCFIETGHGKAMLIDFNYDTQPLPGRFPLPGVGPFTLLQESAINHWGKLSFRWIYWNLLVRGKELPLDHGLQLAGKWS
jgi:sulfide:quinone oxidoreductase